jgi:putative hydrolase of the HAD superfamily
MEAHPAAARFLYVGDNPDKDFLAPNRLGWTTVMVRDERNLHSPWSGLGEAAPLLVLESFAALVDLR